MKKLLPIIGTVALLLLGGGGFFLYSTLMGGGGKKGKKQTPAQLAKAAHAKERAAMKLREKLRAEGSTVSLGDPLLVNLADPGLAHYVKLSVSMKVDKQSPLAAAGAEATAGPELEEQAEIRDIVRSDVQGFTATQLVTRDGQERLKAKIIADVADETTTLPLAVYFPDLAVQ
jgi:flagellar basal body-associated protein FliL